MRRTAGVALIGIASAVFGPAFAVGAQRPDVRPSIGADAVVFRVSDVSALRLFLRDRDGKNYGSPEAVKSAVTSSGHKLVFAMNAGMYEADRTPTGLFVENGKQLVPHNVQARSQDKHTPNFYLNPNGVFSIGSSGVAILSTFDFAKSPPERVRLATQSGPLLLAGGAIVSRAVATGSDSPQLRNRRNGICLHGKTVLLVEADAMTLHQFAVYLRDELGCLDALYMDGGISSVYDARNGRSDHVSAQNPLGPIIAYVE